MKSMTFDRLKLIRLIILALAAALLIYGAGRGEAESVLRKAVDICLECCGIG